jgi:hypothetical protein
MKRHTIHCCFIAVISLLSALPIVAQQSSDTVYVARFGAKPYSYTNCVKEVQNAIRACKERHAKVLVFEKGRYDFWPEGAERREYFISNTSTEDECPSKMKTIGLLFEDMSGLTVEGNDAMLMFHGKMTTIALAHCRAMRLQGLHVDFERPTASELTYTKADGKGVVVTAHRDTRYEIVDGKIQLHGEGWRSNIFHCIEYDPSSEHFFYSDGWKVLSSSKAEEVAPGVIRFNTPSNFHPQIGNTLTVRDIIRDQVGMFIYESSDITLESMKMHYMHGLGIISQYTRNITMKEVDCQPREGSGRLLASSADFMHFSGCSGKISILNCRYMGAHDDAINIHGTNLRAVEKVDTRTLTLRFMHGQSYGFDAYFKGDTVAFVHPSTLQRYAYACVKEVKRLSPRNVQLSFDRDIPSQLVLNSDCVENMTCTPEVEIRHCYFTRTSTRGTLVTTPRKVVIADNTYYKTGMSAILIEGDAEGWFESGPVRDVLIRNNSFIDCGYNGGPGNAIIALHPSNTVVDANLPVHRNVRIIGNTFRSFGNPLLYAKSTAGLVFTDNKVEADAGVDLSSKEMFIITGCKNCKIKK